MPKFRFTAMGADGAEVTGTIEAESSAKAAGLIREKGLFPASVTEVGGGRSRPVVARKAGPAPADAGKGFLSLELRVPGFLKDLMVHVRAKQMAVFTRQLATLVQAGLPLLRGIQVLLKQERNPHLRAALTGISESVEGGSTFAEALAHHPRIFDKLYVNMIRAGEAGGVLEVVLLRLAEFMEKAERIKNRVKSAMVYPLVVLIMAVGILVFLMLVIIPKFSEIFNDLLEGEQLPGLTRFVMRVSDTLVHRGLYVLAAVIAIGFGFRMLGRTKGGRLAVDAFLLKAPIFGSLVQKRAVAGFTRTLGTLLTSGVPILQALNIVKETAGNETVSRAIVKVHDAVKEGDSMVSPMEASKVFPGMVISMVDVGEETGKLPEMLNKIADTYDDEVDSAVDALTKTLEPLMIVLLAVIVGTIVIAMFMPLIAIIQKMGQ